MANVAVCGWYNKGNIGDESYKLSFPKIFPQHKLTFCETPIGINADAFILGGGDIVSPLFLKPMLGIKNKHALSVTVSEPTNFLKDYNHIAVRDMRSMTNCGLSGVKAMYVPDFAFALDCNRERGKELIKKQFVSNELYTKVVVVVINNHLVPQHWGSARELMAFQQLAFEFTTAMDFTSASFLFVPFGQKMPYDDRITNSWVSHRCKWWKKNVVIYDQLGVQDTLDIISAADAVISTRLHSTIFACITGTPFIDITHNHKNQGFLETVGLMKYSMQYAGIQSDALVNKLQSIIGSSVIRDELNKVTMKQRGILNGFSKTVSLFEG